MHHRLKKIILGLLALSVVSISSFGTLLSPLPAQAQIPVTVTTDLPKTAGDFADALYEGFRTVALAAITKMAGYTIRRFAYDSAVWLASGGGGQGPLAHVDQFGEYLVNVGGNAAGFAIEEFSNGAGFNLCKIPDLKVDLALKVGLRNSFSGLGPGPAGLNKKPNCTLGEFTQNWLTEDAWRSKYGSKGVGDVFNATLKVDDSDLGIYLDAQQKIADTIRAETVAMTLQRQEGQGFKAKESPTSKQIQTPPALIAEQFKGLTPEKQAEAEQAQFNALLSSGDVKVIPAALSLFLSTLVGTAVDNYRNKGILPLEGFKCLAIDCPPETGSVSQGLAEEIYGVSAGSARQASQFFDYLKTVDLGESANYDIVSQLNNCSDSPGLYNCRADDKLIFAIRQAELKRPVTIREALQNGWLRGDWQLIPPALTAQNTDRNCYNKQYCYGNIKVLRQLRILPLGFEIAALKSNPDRPWKLKDVVAGFDQCNPNDPGIEDPSKPYCHLIDPNWVIRAFPARCNALGYGANLLTDQVSDRLQECVDLQTCVKYNADGSCASDGYAYCTREKNKWDFSATKCEPQNATCRAFTDAGGRQVAYLYRTLDSGSCDSTNVGCRAYSLTQEDGKWISPALGTSGNSGIFFDKDIPSNCSAKAIGCSAFEVADATKSIIYRKKAPDYLKCYDANPSTPQVEWPKTVSDLARMEPDASCKQYAGVCIPDEVSCNLYTAAGGTTQIPGKYTPKQVIDGSTIWNDECDAKCVGYATFREVPSNYSNGQPLSYLVPTPIPGLPDSNKKCTADEEGCSAFTNLGTTEGGLEKVDYFSKLRLCAKPGAQPTKTFITYEGVQRGGYQLKTYTLVENQDPVNGPIGAPKYYYRDQAELAHHLTTCTRELYRQGLVTADCREFTDEAGNTYYRLLNYTIPVSESCTSYRLNSEELDVETTITSRTACEGRPGSGLWENNTCKVCFQNGTYDRGSCIYDGLPGGVTTNAGASKVCSAAAESCRAYRGNAGNNTKLVFRDTFESASSTVALSTWVGATLSAESTHVGEHSLQYTGNSGLIKNVALIPGESYDLTFWAKGNNGSITVMLGETLANLREVGKIGVSDLWNYYHVSSFEYNGTTDSARLVFIPSQGDQVFLDNVELVQVEKLQYLIKKTLVVPTECDAIQSDNLPGDALGCTAYKDANKQPVNLVNFSHLCRREAIGCTAVLDTKNTGEKTIRLYNVWLQGDSSVAPSATLGEQTKSCSVPVGANGCYVNFDKPNTNLSLQQIRAVLPAGSLVQSTVYIGPDTPAGDPIYIVADEPSTCNKADVGCSYVGLEVRTPTGVSFVTSSVVNNPANYEKALCQVDAVGCSQYNDGEDSRFFKDPAVVGQKICAYKENVSVNDITSKGWFWKNVGKCKASPNKNCSVNSDCGGGDTCENIGNIPCYPNYFNGGSYDLWSYGNTSTYDNFVGECSPEKNRCTEFVDRNDKIDGTPSAHYLIFDDKLSKNDCDGQVSLKEGCALFDKTDNSNKYYNTAALYGLSAQRNGQKVPAAANNNPGNDANVILKVIPDRTCGEWVQCLRSYPVFDGSSNPPKYKPVCQTLTRCRATDKEECGGGISAASDDVVINEVLNERIYRSRNISWTGMDFAGYSLLGLYPLDELAQWKFSSSTDSPDYRLVKRIACGGRTADNCPLNSDPNAYACVTSGAECGPLSNRGRCVNKVCIRTIEGDNDFRPVEDSVKLTCRAYPEKDSPFPNTKEVTDNAPAFTQVNVCNESLKEVDLATDDPKALKNKDGRACDCNYTKVRYGTYVTKYWNYKDPNEFAPVLGSPNVINDGVPIGLCQGGDRNGQGCRKDFDCHRINLSDVNSQQYKNALANPDLTTGEVDGTCQKVNPKESRKMIGLAGYCLEYDLTRFVNNSKDEHPCLTWYPVEALEGAPDIYNQHLEAGFQSTAGGGRYYCVNSNTANSSGNFNVLVTEELEVVPNVDDACTSDCGEITAIGEGFGRGYFPAQGQAATIKQSDIARISVEALSGEKYYLYPNDRVALANRVPQAGLSLQPTFPNNPNPATVTGYFIGRKNEMIWLNSSQHPGNTTLDTTTGDFHYSAKDLINCDGQNGNCTPTTLPGYDGNIFTDTTDRLWTGSRDETCPIISGPYANDLSVYPANWHAVKIEFHPDTGQFTGIRTFICRNVVGSAGYRYRVTFELKQWCSAIAETIIDPANDNVDGSQPRSIGWTNRLWDGSNYQGLNTVLGYQFSTQQAPFGSLGLSTIMAPTRPPVAISDPRYPRLTNGAFECPPTPTLTCRWNLDQAGGDTSVGAPYSCGIGGAGNNKCYRNDGTAAMPETNANRYNETEAIDFLNNIFANVRLYWNATGNGYGQSANKFVPVIGNASALPPQIHPLGECFGDRKCLELNKSGFTINDKESKDIVVNSNAYRATIKFFARADQNQMPIRKVMVDWNDGNEIQTLRGYFRNRRGLEAAKCGVLGANAGYCINSVTEVRNGDQKCVTDRDCDPVGACVPENLSTSFGTIVNRTCDNDYFEVTNENFFCSETSPAYVKPGEDKDRDGTPDCRNNQGLEFKDGCCVFRPKVQIKDNWGWCNGSCNGTDSGCFDGLSVGSTNQCEATKPAPWTSYNGRLILSPK